MSLRLLPEAVADIAHEVRYLAKRRPVSVESFRSAVVKSLTLIRDNANVGRYSKTRGVREWSVPDWPYVIPYRVIDDEIQVLHIWHTKRKRPKVW